MRLKCIFTILVPQPLSHPFPELREYSRAMPPIAGGFAYPVLQPNLENGRCSPASAGFLQRGLSSLADLCFSLPIIKQSITGYRAFSLLSLCVVVLISS